MQEAFTLTETLADRVRNFRAERIIAVKARDIPQIIEDGPKLVIHLVPLSAFSAASKLDLSEFLGAVVQSQLIDDRRLVIQAAAQAQKAADYILDRNSCSE